MAVRIKSRDLEEQGADRWYVTDGLNAVGPVRLDLLARGIEEGRVPLDSFLRHEGWKVWRPITDFTEEIVEGDAPVDSAAASGAPSTESDALAQLAIADGDRPTLDVASAAERFAASTESDGAPTVRREEGAEGEPPTEIHADLLGPERAIYAQLVSEEEARESQAGRETHVPATMSSPSAPPPANPSARVPSIPPPLSQGAPRITDDVRVSRSSWGPARPADSSEALPDDDLAGAADLSDGLLLLLGALVRRARADAGLLHRMGDDGAQVACASGPDVSPALGLRSRLLDPAVVAAAGGHVVLAEPVAGVAGEATLARLRLLGVDVEGAVMFPLRPRGRLLGFVELGKKERFALRDLARAEAVIAAFVARAESAGWV